VLNYVGTSIVINHPSKWTRPSFSKRTEAINLVQVDTNAGYEAQTNDGSDRDSRSTRVGCRHDPISLSGNIGCSITDGSIVRQFEI
jgi:hypothetical protein